MTSSWMISPQLVWDILIIPREIALRWILQDLTDDKSTFVNLISQLFVVIRQSYHT